VVADYKGGVLVPPPNPEALALGIEAAAELAGHRHEDPHSWERTNAKPPKDVRQSVKVYVDLYMNFTKEGISATTCRRILPR